MGTPGIDWVRSGVRTRSGLAHNHLKIGATKTTGNNSNNFSKGNRSNGGVEVHTSTMIRMAA